MVNKPLLPFSSWRGFKIDKDGFCELETAYDAAIPEPARKSLLAIGDTYVANCSWQTWHDVDAMLPSLRNAARSFWRLAYGKSRRTNASVQLEALFERHLGEQVVQIAPERGDLRILKDTGWVPYPIPEGSHCGVYPSPEVLQQLAIILSAAVTLTEKEIAAAIAKAIKAPGPPRHAAVDQLILQLIASAREFGLPRSPYVDGLLPAPFARFVSRFLEFGPPEEYRIRKSDGAMAAQIRRVRDAAARREREQTRRRLRAKMLG